MKGISAIVKKSQDIICEDRSTWIDLYYNFEKDTVYTKPGPERFRVTSLINPCTSKDINKAVMRWKLM